MGMGLRMRPPAAAALLLALPPAATLYLQGQLQSQLQVDLRLLHTQGLREGGGA